MTHPPFEKHAETPRIEHITIPGISQEFAYATLIWEPHPFPFCRLHKLFVHPDERGHGYGATLIEQMNKRILSRGVPAILTNVAATNKNPILNPVTRKPHSIKNIYADHGWTYPCGEHEPFMVFNAAGKTLYEMLDALHIMSPSYAQRLREEYSDSVL